MVRRLTLLKLRDSHLSFSPVESELIPDTPGLMRRRSGTYGLYSSVKDQEGEGLRMATVSIRYIVDDVDAAIAFYCRYLDFHEQMHPAPTFAMLSRGDLRLVLSAPSGQGGGGQSMPDGTKPQPGGWNRFSLEVADLDGIVEVLRQEGVHFRNDIVTGVGGKQVLIEDPSGNPVELFEPSLPEARLNDR